MIIVIFEVSLNDKGSKEYFDIAAQLTENLSQVDGFIRAERFQSLTCQNKYVSLSFWRDEEAIHKWKSNLAHQQAQDKGISSLFNDYQIWVSNVMRSYTLAQRLSGEQT